MLISMTDPFYYQIGDNFKAYTCIIFGIYLVYLLITEASIRELGNAGIRCISTSRDLCLRILALVISK